MCAFQRVLQTTARNGHISHLERLQVAMQGPRRVTSCKIHTGPDGQSSCGPNSQQDDNAEKHNWMPRARGLAHPGGCS